MAELKLQNQQIFLNGDQLSSVLNQIGLNYSAEMLDSSTFGTGSRKRLAGLKTVGAEVSGFWAPSTTTSTGREKDMFDAVGRTSTDVMSFGAEDATVNSRAFFFRPKVASFNLLGSIGEIAPFTLGAEGDGELIRGLVAENGTRTGTGNGTIINLGQVAAGQRIYASLHATSVTGSWTVIIQSDNSTGFGTPLTRLTFSAVSTSTGSVDGQWRNSTGGAITDTHWRAVVTESTGSPGTLSSFVAFGIK